MDDLKINFTQLNITNSDKVIKIQRTYKIYLSNKNVLSIKNWKQKYKKIIKNYTESQYDYYKLNDAPIEVLELVSMESKRFGSVSEKIISNIFNLEPRTSSENNGCRKGKKIEIKCARYWSGKNNCKWQHLELQYDFDCVLFGLLDFNGTWKIWAIKKSILMNDLIEKKIVTYQGKQGYWCEKNKIIKFCTEIKSIQDLDIFLDTI